MANSNCRGARYVLPHDENELLVLGTAGTAKVPPNKKTYLRESVASDYQYELQTLDTNTGSSVAPIVQATPAVGLSINGMRVPKPLSSKDRPSASTFIKNPVGPTSITNTEEERSTRNLLQPFIPIAVRSNELLPDGEILDLSPLENELPLSVDFPPFFHLDEYEKPLDRDDYEGLCLAALQDEFARKATGEGPVFDRQLEMEEKRCQLSLFEYPLYYLFGIDRTGYFELKEERDRFQSCPWFRFANTKKLDDPENLGSESASIAASTDFSSEYLS
ncbi:LAQU0S06e00386g1_1 [Lachancea quebecensis]|uniref:LAQU0S06e00386g1_1 n=1 Tax=Lachancea quebecensis TaxID=1654605 RepID=A0A0P1KS53_9SACH|nr:LAQU0S06e00386g1_1 [Lachancea quebecensis]